MPRRSAPMAIAMLAASMALALAALPALAASSVPVKEAWYRYSATDEATSPLCDAGIPAPGCADDATGGALRPNPYPQDTLHVSVNTGSKDTVTLLEVERPDVQPDQVVAFQLHLPVARASDGTLDEVAARFQACPATGEIEDGVEAAPPAEAPPVDCTIAARAIYQAAADEQSRASFVIDLRPLVAVSSGATLLIALVPTEAALTEGDTWHVAFSGKDREDETTPGLTIVTEVAAAEPADPAPSSPSSVEPPPVPPTNPPRGEFVAPPVPVAQPSVAPTPEPPPVAAPPAEKPQPEAAPRRIAFPIGLVYPGVFAVPLVLVLVGGYAANALARPMDLQE